MTDEIMLLLVIIALPILMIVAFLIAHLISHVDDQKQQKEIDAISAKYAARKIADDKHHTDFMVKIDKIANVDWDRLDLLTDATKAYREALKARYAEDSEHHCAVMDTLTTQFANINKIDFALAERIRDKQHFVPA
jgi:Skp family chaperone for outer membrane proteins